MTLEEVLDIAQLHKIFPNLMDLLSLGVAAGFQLVAVDSWGSTTPTGVPEGMTYGGYVIFKINNSGRYIGFLASAIGSSHHALGFGENLETFVWLKVAYQE